MCPSQRNALLSALGYLDPSGLKVIKFDITDVKPRLPYHVAFQIHVGYSKYTIKRTIVDEGAATCVMSLVYWKSLGSPNLSQYPTMLTSFDVVPSSLMVFFLPFGPVRWEDGRGGCQGG
jgi:hypothetical protein